MIIFRYLSKEIFSTLLATTLILLIIFIINQFIHYLNDAAVGKITIEAVMKVMSFQVPLLLGYLLPLGLFLGGLLALSRMAVDHEMVILIACGVSRIQIIGMLMVLATFIGIVVAWLMLSVEPKMQWYRVKILRDAVEKSSLEKILPGRFQLIGNDGRVFYANMVNDHHQNILKVFLAQPHISKGKNYWDLIFADQAKEVNTIKGEHFILFKNGFRYMGIPGELQYDIMKFGEYGVRLIPPTINNIAGCTDAMLTVKLWHLRNTDLGAVAELQWRIAIPLSVWIFALLIVPLSEVNPRKGKVAQILMAVLIYIGYVNFMFLSRTWIKEGIVNQYIGLWWILIFLFLLAIGLLFFQSHLWYQFRYNKRTMCSS